jgi:hypothetical protein
VIERVAEERLSLSLNLVNRCRLVSAWHQTEERFLSTPWTRKLGKLQSP